MSRVEQKNVLKKIKAELFKDKQNFLFIAWGQTKLYV